MLADSDSSACQQAAIFVFSQSPSGITTQNVIYQIFKKQTNIFSIPILKYKRILYVQLDYTTAI